MNLRALAIHLGAPGTARRVRIGLLLQYEGLDGALVTRFRPDAGFRALRQQPTVSLAFLAEDAPSQDLLWAGETSALFTGAYSPSRGWQLPPFFQNLLPEGVLRVRMAGLRGCDAADSFELLAACGHDLPGNIYASPAQPSRRELVHLFSGGNGQYSCLPVSEPQPGCFGLAGVQPKLVVAKQAGRYGPDLTGEGHLIAKLPVPSSPNLPELEELSLHLARLAGVTVCDAYLEPLSLLDADHGCDVHNAEAGSQFLAVVRFDRGPRGRVHSEDFAQVFAELPEDKYGGAARRTRPITYLQVARVMMGEPSLGEGAVHELLRRLAVNELAQNADMHLKNIGLVYPNGVSPELAPAYDIVALGAYGKKTGHALHIVPPAMLPKPAKGATPGQAGAKQMLTPAILRAFCADLGIPEKPAAAAISATVRAAMEKWPDVIAQSSLPKRQKALLVKHLNEHDLVTALAKRLTKPHGKPSRGPAKDWEQPNLFG